MAYDIIGTVYKVGPTETIPTRQGNTIMRRTLILEQRRYDPNTGQEYQPNYPAFEFTNQQCRDLDLYPSGTSVRIRFDVSGSLYADKQTGEERNISRLRAFRIEQYRQPSQQPAAQQVQQPIQQQYQQPIMPTRPIQPTAQQAQPTQQEMHQYQQNDIPF